MSDQDNYHELNYGDNARHYERYAAGADLQSEARSWLAQDTVDAWRHNRMYSALDPLLAADPGARWLTVGDGRYGKDARYIAQRGGAVVASDLDDTLLAEARQAGLIPDFSKQNAESLTFAAESFEYVLCKESYHHFPRPALALYEMLRVSTKAVVLIEPNDRFICYSPLRRLFALLAESLLSLAGRAIPRHSFEEFGNYVYCISRRELEKVALGLNYRCIAFKGINDHYIPGVEHEMVSEEGGRLKALKRRIHLRDLLCRLRVVDHGMLAAVIFKGAPSAALCQRLSEQGYEIVQLPENPCPHGSVKNDRAPI